MNVLKNVSGGSKADLQRQIARYYAQNAVAYTLPVRGTVQPVIRRYSKSQNKIK